MDHETEISNVVVDNSATICVPNLPSYATQKSLGKLFKNYGQIQEIQIESSKNSKFRNGNITFLERCNAVSAMISMNNTVYRHKQFNIVMSKRKIKLLREHQNRMEDKLAYQNLTKETPLKNLSSMVKNIDRKSSNLEENPEAEVSNPDTEEETVMTTSNNVQTKKSCKRKIKSNLQEDTTKSSKSDIGDISKKNQSELGVEMLYFWQF